MAEGAEHPDAVRVAEAFGAVARALAAHDDPPATMKGIVTLAVDNLDSCEFAGISLVERRRITSPATSDEVPRTVDAIQAEVDEGPCLDAIRDHEVVRSTDLRAERRWPRFAARAHAETGVRSILGLRLFVEGDTMGALNLYSCRVDAFRGDDVALASVFAAHAAVALSASRRKEQLEHKADTRDLIGQAKGILMAHSRLGPDEAFDMLRRASQRLNTKLVDVAAGIVRGEGGGPVPPPGARQP
jgi:GAF domain-containing protein